MMKNDHRSFDSKGGRPSVDTAPSLRVPVTAANRAFLRWLRAAELSAFEAGSVCASKRPFAESRSILHLRHH